MIPICGCVKEPQDKQELKGCHFGGLYYYRHEEDELGNFYYRVFPEGYTDAGRPYYKTCSEKVFGEYFRIIT